jgi:hypothetical protein
MKNKLNYVLLLLTLIGCNSGVLVPSVYVDIKNGTVVCNNCKTKIVYATINNSSDSEVVYSYKNYLIDNSIIDFDTVKFLDLKNRNDSQIYLKRADLSNSNFEFWVEFETRSGSFFPPFVLKMPSLHNKDSIFELKRVIED